MLYSDRGIVLQVAMIILDNALKYSDEQGKISVTLSHLKRQIALTVKTPGQELRERSFPKYSTAFIAARPPAALKTKGSGWGLAMAKSLLDKIGGEIQAQSVQGGSTTFTIIFKGW